MWISSRSSAGATRIRNRLSRLAAVAAVMPLMVTACANAEEPTTARTDLVIGQHRLLTDFAADNRGAPKAIVTDQLYNVLIRFYEGTPEPQPELASSWEVAPDGTSITLHLEEDVTFHDGDPFTSRDVAFSIEYVLDPGNAANARSMAALIAEVQTPDDHTVVVNFSQPYPAMFNMFRLIYMFDHRHPEDAGVAGNGTGPFVLKEFVPDRHVILTRNDNYWREPAQLEKVTIKLLPDPQTKLAQLRAGTVDLITEVPAIDYASFQGSDKWVTGATAGHDLYQSFLINTTRKPLDDPKVRQALSLAVDRERIAADAIGAGSQPACLPYPAESLAYFDDLATRCRFDLEAAKTLLQEAGASDLSFTLQAAGGNRNGARAAEIFQADLAKIGVKVTIDEQDGPTFKSNRNSGNFDVISQLYGGANADPASFFGSARPWKPEGNWANFKSDEYTNLVAEAGSTIDEGARRDTYRKVSELILRENFILVLGENPYLWAAASPLAGLKFGPEGGYLILEFAHWAR